MFNDDPKYGLGFTYVFVILLFVMMYNGVSATSSGLVAIPALILGLPIALLSGVGSMGIMGVLFALAVMALFGRYLVLATGVFGKDLVYWSAVALAILLVAH